MVTFLLLYIAHKLLSGHGEQNKPCFLPIPPLFILLSSYFEKKILFAIRAFLSTLKYNNYFGRRVIYGFITVH